MTFVHARTGHVSTLPVAVSGSASYGLYMTIGRTWVGRSKMTSMLSGPSHVWWRAWWMPRMIDSTSATLGPAGPAGAEGAEGADGAEGFDGATARRRRQTVRVRPFTRTFTRL